MKKILFASLLFVSLYASAATDPTTVSQKVLESFSKTFVNAEDVIWEKNDKTYLVKFTQGDLDARAAYTEKGALIYSIRYYSAESLLPNVALALKNEYPKAEIKGVTELTKDGQVVFISNLCDDDKWYQVKADAYGNTELMNSFKRADK